MQLSFKYFYSSVFSRVIHKSVAALLSFTVWKHSVENSNKLAHNLDDLDVPRAANSLTLERSYSYETTLILVLTNEINEFLYWAILQYKKTIKSIGG